MAEEDGPIRGYARRTREQSERLRKQREMGMALEEFAAEGIKRRVGGLLDGRHPDARIVGAQVIPVDQHRGSGQT